MAAQPTKHQLSADKGRLTCVCFTTVHWLCSNVFIKLLAILPVKLNVLN